MPPGLAAFVGGERLDGTSNTNGDGGDEMAVWNDWWQCAVCSVGYGNRVRASDVLELKE